MKIPYILALSMTMLLGGCAIDNPAPQKTSLEIQSFQSRQFETDKKTAFNSTMSVFQDLGYIVSSASIETGFIAAESPTKGAQGMAAFFEALGSMRSEGRTAVTAFVEEIGPKATKVRLNFVQRDKTLMEYGKQANNDKPIMDPKVYEAAFNKIGDAVFVRTAQK